MTALYETWRTGRRVGIRFLLAEFLSPPKVYTFSFIVGKIIPKSVSVSTQLLSCIGFKGFQGLGLQGLVAEFISPRKFTLSVLWWVGG